MAKINLDIVFKQTTSERIKCRFCRKSVDGEDGYIKINIDNFDGSWYSNYTKRLVICNKCFKEYLDKITTATEKKKESYNKLVKTKILRSLK